MVTDTRYFSASVVGWSLIHWLISTHSNIQLSRLKNILSSWTHYSFVFCFCHRCRLVLLNKLLEDGNVLYRKSRLREAAHRYSYALSKFPPADELDATFKQLRLNFMLNYSRCKRKMNVSINSTDLLCQCYYVGSKLGGSFATIVGTWR